jgi:uncharacterized protein (DUF1778 family)
MYKNRKLVRDQKIRVYVNESEQAVIDQAADDAGCERASFMRDAALVVARYIQARRQSAANTTLSLSGIEARLARISDDVRYSLA